MFAFRVGISAGMASVSNFINRDYSGRLQKAQMDAAQLTADLGFRLPG